MPVPLDLTRFRSLKPKRDPRAPDASQQQHVVCLAAPQTEDEQFERWDRPDAWCRQNVPHQAGELWSRCRDPRTRDLLFSFSDQGRAALFALFFKDA